MATPRNLAAILVANPITTIGASDTAYIAQNNTTDAGITGANLISQINTLAAAAAESVANGNIAVNFASTALITGTYANGTAGVGATFTYTATGMQALDTGTLSLGVTAFLKNQNGVANGLYIVTTAGATGIATVLTRLTLYNTPALINSNAIIQVLGGATNKGTYWVQNATTTSPGIIIGTTALTYSALLQFTTAGSLPASGDVLTTQSQGRLIAQVADLALQRVSTEVSGTSTGTTTMPLGASPPTSAMGDQYLTQTITPLLQGSTLEIEALVFVTNSTTANQVGVSILNSTSGNVLIANAASIPIAGGCIPIYIRAKFITLNNSPITFTVRAGGNVAGTTTLNPFWGTAACSYIKITEWTT